MNPANDDPAAKAIEAMSFNEWKQYISKRISVARIEAGMSQHELAARSGIDFDFIKRIERAEHSPSFFARSFIAIALNKPIDYFEAVSHV